MQRKPLLMIILLFVIAFPMQTKASEADSLVAEQSPKSGFWHHGVGKLLKSADEMLKKWESSDIDTNYISVPKYDRQIYIGGYGYYQQHDMDFPIMIFESDIPDFLQNYIPSNYNDKRFLSTDMHTTQAEVELGVDWRGLTIELPISLINKYSHSFGLAKNGSVWGFRVRYKHLENMQGYVENAFDDMVVTMVERYGNGQDSPDQSGYLNHDPVESYKRNLHQGDLDLKTFYAEAYYVFNHRKFSLGAGIFADMVQKRPAGSFFLMTNYYQSQLTCNDLLNYSHDQFRTRKLSVGAGYGYNLPFYNGRLCLHFSVIPMISLLNNVHHKGWNDPEADDAPETDSGQEIIDLLFSGYNQHFYDACDYGRDSKFTINGFNRVALNYSFGRYILTFLANYRQYLFSSSSGMKIGNRELDAQVNLCWRF